MTKIISDPSYAEDNGYSREDSFGFYKTQRERDYQEDALVFETITPEELISKEDSSLTPQEIAHRLWTTYQLLDEKPYSEGTTACTTVYDGKGNLITATLADSVSFIVCYDTEGKIKVNRLNSITHKASDPSETQRIKDAKGYVFLGRVNGRLALSRAIGDREYKSCGVCSEASIDITNVAELMNDPKTSAIKIITTSDGFTDDSRDQTKEGHENFLRKTLETIGNTENLSEEELAQRLGHSAVDFMSSTDNTSVGVKTLKKDSLPWLLGVYDGHGGSAASSKVANNIGRLFKKQCSLSPEEYAEQEYSVNKKKENYERDNLSIKDYKIPLWNPSWNEPQPIQKEEDALTSLLSIYSARYTELTNQLFNLPKSKEEASLFLKDLFKEVEFCSHEIETLDLSKMPEDDQQGSKLFLRKAMQDLSEEIQDKFKKLPNEEALEVAFQRALTYKNQLEKKKTIFHKLSHCFFKDPLIFHKMGAIEALITKISKVTEEKTNTSLSEIIEEVKQKYPRCEEYFISREFTKMLGDIYAIEADYAPKEALIR